MKQKSMKKAMLAAAMAAAVGINSTAMAEVDEETKRVGKGFGIGAVVGSIVAGPLGLVVGSAAGAVKVQQDIRDERLIEAEAGRVEAEAELVAARSTLSELRQDLVAATETRGIYEQGLTPSSYALEVMFRTASHAVSDRDRHKLGELAAALGATEGLTVHLEGFADPRGDAEYNLQLSEQRVEAVRQALLEHGVAEERIQALAHGESRTGTTEQDIDGLALERRVSITILNERASKGVAQLNL